MSIVAAAFCPHPPLLVPDVSAGEPVAARAPAVVAVEWLGQRSIDRLVLLGSADTAKVYPAGAVGSFAGYGVDYTVLAGSGINFSVAGAPSDNELPLPLAVGAWLLMEACWDGPVISLTCDANGELPRWPAGERDGLLVMGDGSARRTEKAPGWLDERAAGYDAGVVTALGSGEPTQLKQDLALGSDLLAAGAPAWSAAAQLLAGQTWSAEVSYDDAPYGVGYFVATWTPAPTA
ncbi:MAG: hypothetical protein JWN96_364 [Mycobacterium sp.]|nr:hypothetical protein [Mycobacterium sp.]